jgi:hypothetical protein
LLGFCKKRGAKRGFLHGECGEYRGGSVVVGGAKFDLEKCATFGRFIFGLTIWVVLVLDGYSLLGHLDSARDASATAKASATATTNTGILRSAQDDERSGGRLGWMTTVVGRAIRGNGNVG